MRCAVAAAGLSAVAGCGSDQAEYRNAARPAAPITVTGRIDQTGVHVSPASFGAGPVTLIVSNQSGRPQVVTFETDEVAGSQAGLRRSTGPVGPDSTAEIKVDAREGTYRVAVRDRAIRAATVEVGAPRPSAQDQLLQP